MTELLLKIFIKNSNDTDNPVVRQKYGMLSGIVGITCNIILFLLKFLAGIITGAVSVAADAFNNLSDAGSSIVTFIGFKVSGKPADTEHPFGHGRIEYISGLIVAAAIIVMGVELFRGSVARIFNPDEMYFSILSVIILVGSILMKTWMFLFNRSLGKRLDSAAMLATSTDSLSDCVATAVVLLSLLLWKITGINIDGIAGTIVAIFVFVAGVQAARDTLQPLLGQPADEKLAHKIEDTVKEDEHVIGVHDLIVHDYGPGRRFASLHAELPYNMDMLDAHEIIDTAEKRVKNNLGCDISIHLDPVITDDEQINELRKITNQIISTIDARLSMHDFRVMRGPMMKKLMFDVVVPYDFEISDDVLKKKINSYIKIYDDNCYAVINIDRAMVR